LEIGAILVFVTDTYGCPVISWVRHDDIDAEGVALHTAASLLTPMVISELLGIPASPMTVVQEYEHHTLFLLHIAANLALVMVIEGASQLGVVRVSARRVGHQVSTLLAVKAS
jgi:predicted regulator of Ras-like GTPase activity (Roadblock/LC7/MglB family)